MGHDHADPRAATISADSIEKLAAANAASDASDAVITAAAPALLAGRYELVGLLGSGAMGTVYKARDRELDETVALKVLKKELASSEMIERFRREVKLARRVTHRNVARTFDIGEHGGDRFLTMEFVEGEMLASLLARKGRLGTDLVIRLATDICAGLSAAHAAGVLHRDLKPENVIVATDGHAVITDFGIARVVAAGELTRTVGGIAGTPAYMAPEQVEGVTDLDARADLYALGTMLYELLSGELAWKGESVITVATLRLHRPPPDLRAVMPRVSPELADVVLKLMARRREDRFASAEETAEALLRGASAVPTAGPSGTLPLVPPSWSSLPASRPTGGQATLSPLLQGRVLPGSRIVAVLPVLNLGASEDAYIVDSVNEDVVDLLSVVPGLLVRPRGDTARFTTADRDVRAIGQSLGADVVVDASLRRIGGKVRATFRLIAVEDGFQLWSKRLERAPSELLTIADEAAADIARALTAEHVPNAPKHLDAEAEDLYLRARFLLRRGWGQTGLEAITMIERAAAMAPTDARVLGLHALARARLYGLDGKGLETAARAREIAHAALLLDGQQPEAKVALATVHLMSGETDAMVTVSRQVLAVAPNSLEALEYLGRVIAEAGRFEEGILLLERANAIDPDFITARLGIARTRWLLGDLEAFRHWLGELPVHPGDVAPWFLVQARFALWNRDQSEARALEALLKRTSIPETARLPVHALLRIAGGDTADVHARLSEPGMLPIDTSRPARRAAFNAMIRAELYACIGDEQRALEALEAADANGWFELIALDRCPLFGPFAGSPRFNAIRARVKLRADRVCAAFDARLSNAPCA